MADVAEIAELGARMAAALAEAGYPPELTDNGRGLVEASWTPPPPMPVWDKAREVCQVGALFDGEPVAVWYGRADACGVAILAGLDHPSPGPVTPDKHERCPDCNARTVQRSGPHGPFVGCSAFPRCRWSRSTNRPTRRGSSALAGGHLHPFPRSPTRPGGRQAGPALGLPGRLARHRGPRHVRRAAPVPVVRLRVPRPPPRRGVHVQHPRGLHRHRHRRGASPVDGTAVLVLGRVGVPRLPDLTRTAAAPRRPEVPVTTTAALTCPRCHDALFAGDDYGPCPACRNDLADRAEQRAAWRKIVAMFAGWPAWSDGRWYPPHG